MERATGLEPAMLTRQLGRLLADQLAYARIMYKA